jgi:NADH-quinone oxidoreductase subunit N
MPDYRDIFYLAPEIVLAVWGLFVLLVDVGTARGMSLEARRRRIGVLSLLGVGIALAVAIVVCFVPLFVRGDSSVDRWWLSAANAAYLLDPDPLIFFGTISGDVQSAFFNVLYVALLGLIVGLSMSSSFTEELGEYFALLFWATVGMMLLTAAEELVTLFLTLETMTICLYLSTALEKTRRRSAEAGLKYFVYGSVSSALFLFGLSLVYGMTGTTQLDGIRNVLKTGATAGLSGNVAGATAILLLMVGFGFKIAAVPFHQWAPDAYEGAPAPVAAWIATGSKVASFVAMMKVFLHALLPWSSPSTSILGPGWIGIVAVIAAVTMTYGNFAALAQRNLKRMLAYSSIAHAGYILVGVAAVSVSMENSKAAAAVLYYLVVYAFANVGAFATAAWLVRDKDSDDIDDLNGLGYQEPMLAICILVLMLSLIGIPPLAGFFGKLYVFMEALNQSQTTHPVSLIWLVALGLLNSVVSAFYYVRVLKAMFMRQPSEKRLAPASRAIAVPIVLGTIVVVLFGIVPDSLISIMRSAAVTMLTKPVIVPAFNTQGLTPRPPQVIPPGSTIMSGPSAYGDMMKRSAQMKGAGGAAQKGKAAPGKKAQGKTKTGDGGPGSKNAPEKAKSGAGANRSPSARSPLEAVAMKVTSNP